MFFSGKIDIGYIPDRWIIGLSKIPRIVNYITKRKPILQELLPNEILKYLQKLVSPKGIIVICTGTHACISCRGIEKEVSVVTSAISGAFEKYEVKEEFLKL